MPGRSTQPVTITVTIHGTNDVPVIGGVSTGDVTEDVNVVAGNISTSGALTIADVDAGQSNFTVQASTPGSNGFGTFTLAANGAWTYTANDSLARDPAARCRPVAHRQLHRGLERWHRQPGRHRHHPRHQRRAGDRRREHR